MAMMLSQLLATPLGEDVEVRDIKDDSRRVNPGDVFFSLAQNPTKFVNQALGRGAEAIVALPGAERPANLSNGLFQTVPDLRERMGVIASRFYGDPSQHMRVVAVTGTNGKTSFTHLLSDAINAAGDKCGLIGTLGYGLPGDLKDPGLTTPAPIDLQKRLAAMRDIQCDVVAVEASSHGIAQSRLSGTAVDVAVLTNITRDHLDYHGSFENYCLAKQQLFLMDSVNRVVINLDDNYAPTLLDSLKERAAVFSYSVDSVDSADNEATPADVVLLASTLHSTGMTLTLRFQGSTEMVVNVPLIGRFNIENLLAAAASMLALDYKVEQIAPALEAVSPVAGRMEVLTESDQPSVVIDYAHTPDALEKALVAIKEHFPDQNIYCVFGCGGDRDSGKRPLMGHAASQHASHLIVTNDNPRDEAPETIAQAIVSGVKTSDARVILDRRTAIRTALSEAKFGDVVLIAGKGHEDYQEVAGAREPFSDRAVVKAAFAGELTGNVIAGIGETGLSFARYLSGKGEAFIAVDDKPVESNVVRLREIQPDVAIDLMSDDSLNRATKIFLSPGIPLSSRSMSDARNAGVPVVGDVSLFGELAAAPIAAVTGTNGKSTVVSLLDLLASAQKNGVYLGGNIGTPCLDILSDDAELYVLEVSSYQLELAGHLNARVAVVLNLSPDHLNRYSSLQAYYDTKLSIYHHAESAVIHRNLAGIIAWDMNKPVATFGLDKGETEFDFGLVVEGDVRWLAVGARKLCPVSDLSIVGDHNVENCLAALALGSMLGLDLNLMVETLKSFQGLPHRGEVVGLVDGVRYINDSKATNPGAMIKSVAGFAQDKKLILIAGGDAKGLDFSEAARAIGSSIKHVFLIGEQTDDIAASFVDLPLSVAQILKSAVEQAAALADSGDTVLLSPGCASQDQFSNYAERGDAFRAIVGGLSR